MPKIIQTGETITLSSLVIRGMTFQYVDRGDPPKPELVLLVRYDRLKADGTVHDSCVCEKPIPAAIKAAIETRWPLEEARCKADEGI